MADQYIKSYLRNGHDIAIRVDAAMGTPSPVGSVTEETSNIYGYYDNLLSVSVTASATGSTVTDSSLTNKHIAKVGLPDGTFRYTNAFAKLYAANSLQFTDSTTVTMGQSIVFYYLPGTESASTLNVRKMNLGDEVGRMQDELNTLADGVNNSEIYTLLVSGFGFDKDT